MKEIKKQGLLYCAIYCRLSQEDEKTGISGSILNQKEFLRDYALKEGWNIYDIYMDDGISGTTFEREGFQQMIADIERGKIDIVIVKDLSRLGRNYLKTGYYTEEFFPNHGVRFVAVNDNIDTINEDQNEFAPFKNIINEWYAKDISKKVKFSIDNKMKSLVQVKTSIPIYGYAFNENGERIIDETTAQVVKYIFNSYSNGLSGSEIAKLLTEKKVVTISYYNFLKYNCNAKKYASYDEEKSYAWDAYMVLKILHKKEYLGHYIRGKSKGTFKKKQRTYIKNEEDLYIKKNCFPAIVSEQKFKEVEEKLKNKRVSNSDNIFSGLITCGSCGQHVRINSNFETIKKLYCRERKTKRCGAIKYDTLVEIISKDIKNIIDFIGSRTDSFLAFAEINSEKRYNNANNKLEEKIKKLELQREEVMNNISNLFKSYTKNEVESYLYKELMDKYVLEKSNVEMEIKRIKSINFNMELENEYKTTINSANDFIDSVNKYREGFVLDKTSISIFIKHIYIKKKDSSESEDFMKTNVEIVYNNCDDLLKGFILNENNSGIIS